jgi:hypothetical protein
MRLAREWENGLSVESYREPGSARAKAMVRGAALKDALRLGMKEGGIPRSPRAERVSVTVSQLLRVLSAGSPVETAEVLKTVRFVRQSLQELSSEELSRKGDNT